jgi:pimeloyl-ACP methyl ester carboxylesterase
MLRIGSLALITVTTLVALVTPGCTRATEARATADGAAPPASAQRAQAQESVAISTVPVAGDDPVLVVAGNPSVHRPIVHLHGMCERPRANLEAWGAVARDHGTIIALVGDVPCPEKAGATKWSDDAEKIDERIDAAIDAVNMAKGNRLDTSEIVLVGESMGAARAELLAREIPDRYTRLVLIGSPQTASPANLRSARAVANLAGEKEPQQRAKEATRALASAGLAARFWELPGATHGQYGPDGERIMSEAIAFVATR